VATINETESLFYKNTEVRKSGYLRTLCEFKKPSVGRAITFTK